MESEIKEVSVEELKQLIQDVALIKNILVSEGELTEWAKNELVKARKTPELQYISLEKL